MSNYPDDIRQYDNDQRSPFYDDKHERYIEILSHEIAIDPETMIDVLSDSEERYGNIVNIICMLVEKRYAHIPHDDEVEKLTSAWMDLAEDAAKQYEENKRIYRW